MLSWSYEIVEHEGFKAGRIKHNGLTEVRADKLNKDEPLVEELKREIFDISFCKWRNRGQENAC